MIFVFFLFVCLFSAIWVSLASVKLLLLKYTNTVVHEYVSILFLIPIYMVWFTNEENIEDYSNVLGLSIPYFVALNQLQIKRSIIFFPLNVFMISTTIFFPSFLTKEFGSLKMWDLIQIGICNLLFLIFDGKPFQVEGRLQPMVFFTRKFKIVF